MQESLKQRYGPDISRFEFLKHYRLLIRFDNIGATPAKIFATRLYSDTSSELLGNQPIDKSDQGTPLNPHRFYVVYDDIRIPISQKLPSPWTVHLHVSFSDINGNNRVMRTILRYDRQDGWNAK